MRDDPVYQWINPGDYGVFVFFIISGYIVPASLERKGSVRTFWVSRLFRLYPLYLLAVGIALALYLVHIGSCVARARTRTTSILSQLLMMSNVLAGQNLPNVVWSLSYEMIFYLLLTALFMARYPPPQQQIRASLRGRRGRVRRPAAAGVLQQHPGAAPASSRSSPTCAVLTGLALRSPCAACLACSGRPWPRWSA